MKFNFHKIATYLALILISALPLSENVFADAEKKSNILELLSDDKDALETKRKLLK